ncbi:MAG: NADH-ubiquinone oxidoreductase-F iron-sulfur binding region domain-containing protein [Acidimicrobiia bacterium]
MAYLLPVDPITTLDEYLATDYGGIGISTAMELGEEKTIEIIAAAGLRGRGGGGFPTGRKWQGVASQTGTNHYLVVNGAEGEPGTFKDRYLLRHNAYQVVEGMIIAAYAIGAMEAFICLKASFTEEIEAVTRAIAEMQEAGICKDCAIRVVEGPEEYLFGEEKAMLEVIEGNSPLPRLLPPYEHGLFATAPQTGWVAKDPEPGKAGRFYSNPTLVNNVETLANVPHILANGVGWYREHGTQESPGNVLATIVGDVQSPGVFEVPLGTPLREVIEMAGAPEAGVKAVMSGVATPVITEAMLDTPLTYEHMVAAGTGLGAAGFMVFDQTACMVEVARLASHFLWIESCGQCPPCKLGTEAITDRLTRIEGGAGSISDITEIGGWLGKVNDGARCYLATEEQVMVASMLREFPEEFDAHITGGACPRPREVKFPKLVDLRDGVATYDETYYLKQPDWTYLPLPS